MVVLEPRINKVKRVIYYSQACIGEMSPLLILKTGSVPVDVSKNALVQSLVQSLLAYGISVAYFSDRGVEESNRDMYYDSEVSDLVSDLEQIIGFLNESVGDRHSGIGLCGHSMGGIVSLAASLQTSLARYVITLSTPYTGMLRSAVYQKRRRWVDANTEVFRAVMKYYVSLFIALKQRSDLYALYDMFKTMEEVKGRNDCYYFPQDVIPNEFEKEVAKCNRLYYFSEYSFDVDGTLREIHVPVFAIFSENDERIHSGSNVRKLQMVANAYGKRITVKSISGCNHMYESVDSDSVICTVVKEMVQYIKSLQ